MTRVSLEKAEQAFMDRFVQAYKILYGIQLVNIEKRESPDYKAYDPQKESYLGIEITSVYQNTEEAKIQYSAVENWNIFHGSLEELISKLNLILINKANKSYKYENIGELVLAIWVGSLVFNEKIDFDFIKNKITIPNNCYKRIWLILHNSKDNMPQLYEIQ
jgi:hypothetical protein